jgi:hypothetical protein
MSAAAPMQARLGALPAGLGVGLARISLAGRPAAAHAPPGPPPYPTARAAALAPDGAYAADRPAAPRPAAGAPGRPTGALRLAPAPSGSWGSGVSGAWAPWAMDALGAGPAEPAELGALGGEQGSREEVWPWSGPGGALHAGSEHGSAAMPDARAARAGHAELAADGGMASSILYGQAAGAAGSLGPAQPGRWGASGSPTSGAAARRKAAGPWDARSACSAADVFGPLCAESAAGPALAELEQQACGQEAVELRAWEASSSDGAAQLQDGQAGHVMPGLLAAGTGVLAEHGRAQAGAVSAPEQAGNSMDSDALVCAEALSDEAVAPHPAASPAEAAASSAPAADSGEGGACLSRPPVRQSTFVTALAGGARRGTAAEPGERTPPASLARPGSGEAAADAEGRCDRAGRAAAAAQEQGLVQSRSGAGEAARQERRAAPAPSGAGGAAGSMPGAAGLPGAGGSLRARVRSCSQRPASQALLCLMLVIDHVYRCRTTECMWR